MSLGTFVTYQHAVSLHRLILKLSFPIYLRDQVLRSSSSIALNVAEGHGKLTAPDKRKYYSIALGSLRETSAALELSGLEVSAEMKSLIDQLGACLWRLT
jgi:four helix bundle protein